MQFKNIILVEGDGIDPYVNDAIASNGNYRTNFSNRVFPGEKAIVLFRIGNEAWMRRRDIPCLFVFKFQSRFESRFLFLV